MAIKVLRPDFQTDDDFQARFLREARTLAKLRHPYIVTVYDLGRLDELYYLVMEFVEGTSLRQRLVEHSISERDTLDFVPQIAEALQHAHETGVVHRDVKPENVLIDSRGRVRLVDFGLATLFGPQAARSPDDDRVAGTLGYMAPEQFTMPEAVDHRADIYSTGVVFYEMLAGCLPKADRVPPSRKAASDPRLDPIVMRALERERERRYQEARLLHSEITAARPHAGIRRSASSSTLPPRSSRSSTPGPIPEGWPTWLRPATTSGRPTPRSTFRSEAPTACTCTRRARINPTSCRGTTARSTDRGRLSFTWAWSTPPSDTQETQVTLDFHARGETTDLVLTHERFRDEGSRNGHAKGWQGCLGRLARKFGP